MIIRDTSEPTVVAAEPAAQPTPEPKSVPLLTLPPMVPKQHQRPAQSNIPDDRRVRDALKRTAAEHVERESLVPPLTFDELRDHTDEVLRIARVDSIYHDYTAVLVMHILPQFAEFNNAFFNPFDLSMNYGDGDGFTFTFFSAALDVVAHELTHAVTQFTSDLIYLNESGALNEAISDIMSAGVEFEFEPLGSGRQRAEWLLGEDLFIGFGPSIRSLIDPLSVGDPDHYSIRCDVQCPESVDNGGVHINASIVTHAFYLMVVGGTNRTSGITVAGLGMDQMDRVESIFFRAFVFFLVPSSDFSDAREATLRAAREIHGAESPEERAVRDGWNAVGVR